MCVAMALPVSQSAIAAADARATVAAAAQWKFLEEARAAEKAKDLAELQAWVVAVRATVLTLAAATCSSIL